MSETFAAPVVATASRAVPIGLRRGGAMYAQFLRDRREFGMGLIGTVGIFAALVLWIGDEPVKGTGASTGSLVAAGFVAFSVLSVGLYSLPTAITTDREEGALLRLRAVPHGLPAYLVGHAVSTLCQTLTYVVAMLAVALPLTDIALPSSAAGLLTLVWVLVLGTLAVAPLGAAIGGVLPSSRSAAGILALPMTGLMLISGVTFPVTAMPEALRWVAQAFPLYWQALGLRSVLLPDSMRAAEIGANWRPRETALVLGLWAIAGMVLAPLLLRRSSLRESGSRLTARRARGARSGS